MNMSVEQAIALLDQVTQNISTSRQQHLAIVEALRVLKGATCTGVSAVQPPPLKKVES